MNALYVFVLGRHCFHISMVYRHNPKCQNAGKMYIYSLGLHWLRVRSIFSPFRRKWEPSSVHRACFDLSQGALEPGCTRYLILFGTWFAYIVSHLPQYKITWIRTYLEHSSFEGTFSYPAGRFSYLKLNIQTFTAYNIYSVREWNQATLKRWDKKSSLQLRGIVWAFHGALMNQCNHGTYYC